MEISREDLLYMLDEAVRLAQRHWSSLDEIPAYPTTSATQTQDLFSRAWTEQGRGKEVLADFDLIAAHSRPSGGKFFGYVFGSGEPVSAISDFLAGVLNQNATSWRSGPAASQIEHTVVGWLAEAVGCGGFVGSLCGGGSSANLMGLAMAREAKLPANEAGFRPCVVYASEEVHMSIPKAISLLGIGNRNLRLIPVDDRFEMRTDLLAAAIAADREAGNTPIAIVASAGTVATGAIDPLVAISAIARQSNLWLHVDGAFGGLAALAEPRKFAGMNLADSFSLDAHKWLYQTVDCGCLLYRDRQIARQTFANSGDYVKPQTGNAAEAFAFFDESFELSRRFRALKLWLSLQFYGRQAFRAAILRDLEHAALLADLIRSQSELELLAPVPLSAVCFRHRSKDNRSILGRVTARGRVFISNATIGGQFALRACFVNHRARDEDVRAIVPEVLAAAAEVNS